VVIEIQGPNFQKILLTKEYFYDIIFPTYQTESIRIMAKYERKIQVLLTEEQFQDLDRIAMEQNKKLGTLVREAIEEYHLKQAKQHRIAAAVDKLLALPDVRAPKNYQDWEKKYLKGKYPRL
jgi:hypothetical protein